MTEEVKRLKPTSETLKRLFLLSGNFCAFPGCSKLMMDENGVFIGQVCHIEAAEKGGQRFNASMTNEERRAFNNLMLMCYEHHKVTDDVKQYDVARLKQMKSDHEIRFSDPQRAIREKLVDWTELGTATTVTNLEKLGEELKWPSRDEHPYEEEIQELNEYIKAFRDVPIEFRRFLGAVARRTWKMRGTHVVKESMRSTSILISDIESALQLTGSDIAKFISVMESYNLMSLDEIDTSFRPEPAIMVHGLRCGWNHWPSLMEFCETSTISDTVFVEDLDFARLDK